MYRSVITAEAGTFGLWLHGVFYRDISCDKKTADLVHHAMWPAVRSNNNISETPGRSLSVLIIGFVDI